MDGGSCCDAGYICCSDSDGCCLDSGKIAWVLLAVVVFIAVLTIAFHFCYLKALKKKEQLEAKVSPPPAVSRASSPTQAQASQTEDIVQWIEGEYLGSGGFGDVFVAMNASTGEMMAVKRCKISLSQVSHALAFASSRLSFPLSSFSL